MTYNTLLVDLFWLTLNAVIMTVYPNIVDHGALFFNPLTSRPGCMPGSRYTGVGVLFFVI